MTRKQWDLLKYLPFEMLTGARLFLTGQTGLDIQIFNMRGHCWALK